jgi:hypothetical protein
MIISYMFHIFYLSSKQKRKEICFLRLSYVSEKITSPVYIDGKLATSIVFEVVLLLSIISDEISWGICLNKYTAAGVCISKCIDQMFLMIMLEISFMTNHLVLHV